MGGLAERQISDALTALRDHNTELAQYVIRTDHRINAQEVNIDEDCTYERWGHWEIVPLGTYESGPPRHLAVDENVAYHEAAAALRRLQAAIDAEGVGGWRPDVLHLHDWQAALALVYLRAPDDALAGAIEAASLEANKRGYNVVLGHAHESAAEAEALTNILEARHCDALLEGSQRRLEIELSVLEPLDDR